MPAELRPVPQQPTLALIAKLFREREALNERFPTMTGTALNFILPSAETVEKWSYGDNPLKLNRSAGSSYASQLDMPYLLESAGMLPLAKPASQAVAKAANTLGDVAVRAITGNPAATGIGVIQEASAMSPLTSVIKPKGGAGWLTGQLSPKAATSRFRETLPYARVGEDFMTNLKQTDPQAYEQYIKFADDIDINFLRSHSTDEWQFEAINRWRASRGEPPIVVDKPTEAINKWVETKLNKYVANEMATPEDPLRKLAEENILHYQPRRVFPDSPIAEEVAASRELTGNPLEGLGQSELAKRWETFADYGITPMTAKDRLHDLIARNTENASTALRQNPWLKNAPPESMTYSPHAYTFIQSADQLGFPHLIDELKNAVDPASTLPAHLRLTPKQLESLEMPNAVKLVSKINKYRADEAIKAEKAGMMANLQTEPRLANKDFQLDFVDKPGATWINVPETVDEKGVRLCTTIGKQGGWCTMDEPRAKEYGSGRNRLVAMVDADGRPHLQATITNPAGTSPSHWMNTLTDEEQIKILDAGVKPGDLPEYKQWLLQQPADITEFKPPGNAFESDRAKKYAERDPAYKQKIDNAVLDFLNSQQWGNVRDIERYGIIDLQNPDHIVKEIRSIFGNKANAGDIFNAAVDENPYAPRFMKRGEFVQFLEPYGPVDGMAKGGLVQDYQLGGLVNLTRKYFAKAAKTAEKEAVKEQKMLQGVYRGYTGEPGDEATLFASPQRRVGEYYAEKRAAQTGDEPHVEMLLVDPNAGKEYGHALPIDKLNREFTVTRARKLSPEDVVERTQLKAHGGLVEFDPDAIDSLAAELMSEQPVAEVTAPTPSVQATNRPIRPEELQLREGMTSIRPVRGARGDYIARIGTDVAPGIQPFVDVDPWKRLISQYGLQYHHPLPGGGASTEFVVDPVNNARILSGMYKQQLGKDSEISARGAYVQGFDRPSYNVNLEYKKRFATGGLVEFDPAAVDALAQQLIEESYA